MTLCRECAEEAARICEEHAAQYRDQNAKFAIIAVMDEIRAAAGDRVSVPREPTNMMLEMAWDACSKANMEICDGDPNAGPSIIDLLLAWKVMLTAAGAKNDGTAQEPFLDIPEFLRKFPDEPASAPSPAPAVPEGMPELVYFEERDERGRVLVGATVESADALSQWATAQHTARVAADVERDEAHSRFVDALLAELASRGINTDNWDGDEGLLITLAKCIAQAIAEQRIEKESAERALEEMKQLYGAAVMKLQELGVKEVALSRESGKEG